MSTVNKVSLSIAAAVVLLLLGLATTPAHAQTPSVTASVDRTDLTLTDVLTLILRIEGVTNVHPLPQAPVISGLILVGSERRSYQAFVQGALSAHFEFIFKYQPLRTGSIDIDPINVILDNTVHITDPITVNVTGGAGATQSSPGPPPQPTSLVGQDFFAESEVDDDTPYIGQQITYTLRFYSANPFARPIYDAPDFAGFWNPGRSSEEESLANVAGRSYTVTEANTVLFPTLAGDLTIEPTNVTVRGGLLGSSVTQYPTRQINLSVRPLPPGEPDAFTGAVGIYSIAAEVDSNTVDIGNPVTLTVTVTGEGNMESLPAPEWPEIPGWRAFDNDAPYKMSIIDGKVQGSREFERVLIPSASGSHEFPPIEYSYFDPSDEEYVTLTSRSFSVEVLPDPGSPEADPLATSEETEDAEAQDIRYIKPVPDSIARPTSPLTASSVFWLLWLTPLAGVLAVTTLVMYKRRPDPVSSSRDLSAASQAALAKLAAIEPGSSTADAASMALHGYLDVRLERPTSGMSATEIADSLGQIGASAATSERLVELMGRIAEMRFSSREVEGTEEVARDVQAIVRSLDEELSA
ncbi:MAG: protein BatD [Dehalococcoidia bacterium]|nr:protein BatD [Dehalococcoidia bacterium]